MNKIKGYYAVILSVVLALMLMIIHMPPFLQWLRPQWLSLILIYWVFSRPERLGVGFAWCSGLAMDVLVGSMLGQYALAMSLIVYFAHQLRNRMRLFLFWQRLFVIFLLVGIGQLSILAVQWLLGEPVKPWYIISTVSSVLIWPYAYRFLQLFDRRAIL